MCFFISYSTKALAFELSSWFTPIFILAIFGVVYIVVDTVIGVNYLTTVGAGINSLTPLLDSEGNVVIDK